MRLALGISGSPRKDGNTDVAVREALRQIDERSDYRTRFLRVRDYEIKQCIGCRACMTLGHCAILDDDLERLLKIISAAEVLVIGSAVYWNSPPGAMKDFMDRTHGHYVSGGLFAGARAGLISVAGDGGFATLEDAIVPWLRYYGAQTVGTARLLAREKGELASRPQEMAKIAAFVDDLLREGSQS